MALVSADFKARYTEFAKLTDTQVDLALADADAITAADMDTTYREDVVFLQCAHALATSPLGRNARLSEPGKTTVYQVLLTNYYTLHSIGHVLF